MSKFSEALDLAKPTVRLHVRQTPSGSFKLRLMSIDKPSSDGGVFRSAKGDD